ncbi:carboxypeptidase-like regulatory domain-containing protein [Rhodococcus sp. 3Y1]
MAVVAAALVLGALSFTAPAAGSDVGLVVESDASPLFTVGLSVFDGVPPFDADDGPGRDSGPSNRIVREGDPVTYVIDIGIRGVPLPDVVIDLPVQRGFKVTSVPEYCGDGSFLDEIGLLCRVGELEQDRYFTRTVDMTAGPKAEADGLPIAVVVSARGDRSVSAPTTPLCGSRPLQGVCDPYGVSVPDSATTPEGPVVANGTISGVVTSGPASTALIEGVDQCGHAIARSVTPFDGRFSFVGLLPGTYRITVDGRAPVDVGLYPGEMTVNGLML